MVKSMSGGGKVPAPKKSKSTPKSTLSRILTPKVVPIPNKKPIEKIKNKTASTFSTLGGVASGGASGYKTKARKIVNATTKNMTPLEAQQYRKKYLPKAANIMATEARKDAAKAKENLQKNDKGSYIRETSTKQIDYTRRVKPTYKVTGK